MMAYGLYKHTGLVPFFLRKAWQAIAKDDDAGKAIFGFFITSLAYVLGSWAPILARITDLRLEVVYGSFFANNLTIFTFIIVTYFLYVERRIDLAQKLTSFLIVIIMTAFVAVVLAFYTEEEDMPLEDAAFFAEHSLVFTAVSDSQYQAIAAPKSWHNGASLNHVAQQEAVLIDLPFSLQFYGKSYQFLAIKSDGQVFPLQQKEAVPEVMAGPTCVWNQTVIAPLCFLGFNSNIKTSSSSDQMVVTWTVPDTTNQAVMQLIVKRSGQIQFNYENVPAKASIVRETSIGLNNGAGPFLQNASLSALPLVSGNNEALWFDLNFGRRSSIHSRLWPVVAFLVVLFVVVTVGFNVLLNLMIQRPLENIRSGLRKVNNGQLDAPLKQPSRDEFSDVADGFNTMLSSLNETRQRYDEQTELMENELTYRTVQAAKKIDPDLLSKDQVFEQKLRSTIEDNMSNANFQVSELADAMATSTRQLHRRVVNLTAQTPAALIRHLRLEYGHQLLSAKAATVSEAGYKAGFKDVSYFAKLFHKKYGVAPSEVLNSE